MAGEATELIAHQESCDDMRPYERLLGDAMRGDSGLFTRDDCVEAAWRVVDPILDNAAPLVQYEPATWGPPEVQRIMEGDCVWRNPALPRETQI